MTLIQIVQYICNKCKKPDTASQNRCKDFVRDAYEIIWNKIIWTDSLATITQSVPSGTSDITLTSLYLVKSVSWNDKWLENIDEERLFRYRPNWRTASGKPTWFLNRPKVGGNCVIRLDVKPDETQNITVNGKLKFVQLDLDADEPLLKGIDPCLKAFGEAFFLEYLEQRGSAQLKLQEAMGLLKDMVALEDDQETHIVQAQPDQYDYVNNMRNQYFTKDNPI